jgi:hypothetical protein
MSRQNRLPHHPGELLRRQQRAGGNEVHGYEVLHLTFLLSPNFPAGGNPFTKAYGCHPTNPGALARNRVTSIHRAAEKEGILGNPPP